MPRLKSRSAKSPVPGLHAHRQRATRLVEDPFDPAHMIAVPENSRHDPLHRMFSRGDIDAGQHKAGEALRAAWEIVSATGVRAVDHGRVVVDGSRRIPGVPDAAVRAAKLIRQARSLLGWQSYRLVVATACDGLSGSHIAEQSSAKVDRKVVQAQVRAGLEQLAILWGFASDPRHVRKQASMVAMLSERPTWDHEEREISIRYA